MNFMIFHYIQTNLFSINPNLRIVEINKIRKSECHSKTCRQQGGVETVEEESKSNILSHFFSVREKGNL